MFWTRFLSLLIGSLWAIKVQAAKPLIFQRWLMIIKPNSQIPGWSGQATQEDIDRATHAFKVTWPKTIYEITHGQVLFKTDVVVSTSPVTTQGYPGMVTPEDIPDDVDKYVTPEKWDGVLVYNGFSRYSYISNAECSAGVGWVSVNNRPDLQYHSDGVAGWIHESLHTMAWYFEDSRLGPIAPSCPDAPTGYDGTHCGEAYGYTQDSNNLPYWMGWYQDYLLGIVDSTQGLGSQAWAYGSRRETAQQRKPGSDIPKYPNSRKSWGNHTRRPRHPARIHVQ